MLYRIVTERKNTAEVRRILASYGLDYTIYHGMGAYLGTPEPCTIVELSFVSLAAVQAVAYDIGRANTQAVVMVQSIPCDVVMIPTTADAPAPVLSNHAHARPLFAAYSDRITRESFNLSDDMLTEGRA